MIGNLFARRCAAIVLVLLTSFATAQSGGSARQQPHPPSPKTAPLDFEFFKTRVEPIFLKQRPGHARCYACHGSGTGPQYLVKLPQGSTFWTEEQSRLNFTIVSAYVNRKDPMKSALLIHPLSPLDGGDVDWLHGGGRQFASKQDPDWQTMAAWVSGQKLESTPNAH
jgi:hypothetical protein